MEDVDEVIAKQVMAWLNMSQEGPRNVTFVAEGLEDQHWVGQAMDFVAVVKLTMVTVQHFKRPVLIYGADGYGENALLIITPAALLDGGNALDGDACIAAMVKYDDESGAESEVRFYQGILQVLERFGVVVE